MTVYSESFFLPAFFFFFPFRRYNISETGFFTLSATDILDWTVCCKDSLVHCKIIEQHFWPLDACSTYAFHLLPQLL